MDKNFEEKFKELQKGYLNKLRENFSNFKVLLYENPINVQEVYSRVHTISGTSGMYGMYVLSDISTDFEIYLKPIKENPNSLNTEEFKNKFANYLDSIEKIILGDKNGKSSISR